MTVSDIESNKTQFKLSDYRTSSKVTVAALAEILNMRSEAIIALEQGDHYFFGDKGFAIIFLRRYLAHFCVNKPDADLIEQKFLSTVALPSGDKISYKKLMMLSLTFTVCLSYITLQHTENSFFNILSGIKNEYVTVQSDNSFTIVSNAPYDVESTLISMENSVASNVVTRLHRTNNIKDQRDSRLEESKFKVSSFKFESSNRILFTDVANVIIKDKDGYVVFAAKTFPGMSAVLPDEIKNLNVVTDKVNSWAASS